jgi:hypothetical protein
MTDESDRRHVNRAERMHQLKVQAEARQRSVEQASPVRIVTRPSKGVLDPDPSSERFDSSDTDGRLAIGGSEDLDLDALRVSNLDGPTPWFDVARIVVSEFPPPLTDSSRVWVSKMGSLYHRYDDCQTMWGGKRTARDEGMTVHGVRSITLREALETKGGYGHTRSACKVCI